MFKNKTKSSETENNVDYIGEIISSLQKWCQEQQEIERKSSYPRREIERLIYGIEGNDIFINSMEKAAPDYIQVVHGNQCLLVNKDGLLDLLKESNQGMKNLLLDYSGIIPTIIE